ncbi:MAG TPA: NmrA family NAD(P)-binding protein, partial [Myxococcales bacterium]
MTKLLEVLVTGATGKQGGAVAHRLLERGHRVRALTRRLDSPAARALAEEGATLVQGTLDDRASLDRAIGGVDAVFSMTTPFEAGIEAEICQGKTTADAAKAAGAFLVFTSVGSADKKTGIPHVESKRAVEEHIARIGARAAILRPVYFMENAIAFG